jgi:hypothetical protein
MLEISINTQLKPEFDYICSVIFGDILGLEYLVNYLYNLETVNLTFKEKTIIFKNHFWKISDYKSENNLPQNLDYLFCEFTFEKNLPVFFGDSNFEIKANEIEFNFDIFACCFFTLTGLEEFVSDKKDKHNRFVFQSSFLFKNELYKRPIVNEYVEFLWKILLNFDYDKERKEQCFELIPTHDIDHIEFWTSKRKKALLKNLAEDCLKRKNLVLCKNRFISWFKFMVFKENPTNTFAYLINLAEKSGSIARFYFMSGGKTVYDSLYDLNSLEVQNAIKLLKKTNHEIGIHPSYSCMDDSNLLENEIFILEKCIDQKIKFSRQHYLRFDISRTPLQLQDNNIKQDSSAGFSDLIGFRNGICYEYYYFDFVNRKKLEIKSLPLLVMDNALKKISNNQILNDVNEIKNLVKKYKGKFVFLWHNNNIFTPEWIENRLTLEKVFYGE